MRTGLLTLVLGATLLGAAGCSEYHYFDIMVTLDNTLGGNGVRGSIQRCDITVRKGSSSGAIQGDSIVISDPATGSLNCPLSGTSTGTFEYSTLSSDAFSFTVAVYNGANTKPNCKIGEGEVTVQNKETTNAGSVTLVANGMANGTSGCM
jgi:hypothetical protein